MTRKNWRGSVSSNSHGLLRVRLKIDGQWRDRSTGLPDTPANRIKAEEYLAAAVGKLKARDDVMGDESGPVTVRAWAKSWLESRGGADKKNDETRLRLHVHPIIGHLELTEVRPRHIIAIVERLKLDHAPRTTRNVYSACRALFRDAALHELISTAANPCILGTRQLGKVRDAVSTWREGAVFSREELQQLVFPESIPLPRRIVYALAGVGCLRTGELCGLRWARVDLAFDTLDRISVATSYDRGLTKQRRRG